MKTIEELRARLAEIDTERNALNDQFAGQRFDEESKQKFNDLTAERKEIEETIAELEKREALLTEAAESRGDSGIEEGGKRFNAGKKPSKSDLYDLASYRAEATSEAEERKLILDGAKRAIEDTVFPHESADQAANQEHVEKLLRKHPDLAKHVLITGSPVYERAFGKAVIGLPLSAPEQDQLARALSLSGSSGGYAVPFALDPTITITSDGVINPLREISRNEQVSVGEWKSVTSGGITAAYAAAGTEAGDNAPTLGQPDIITERAQAFVPYDIEIGGDWGGLLAEMAKEIQDAKDVLEATKFYNGAGHGSNEPKGIYPAIKDTAGATVTTAATATFAVADLFSLKNALPPRFRPGASFVAEGSQYDRIRQFDTNGGAALWAFLGDSNPEALVGKPNYELSTMDATISSASKIALYGDFSKFVIVDRLGMTVELIPHLFGASGRPIGKRGVYAVWRNSSDVITANAFQVLVAK